MGRQVRMVPPDWQHPKDDDGEYVPLLERSYRKALDEWAEGAKAWAARKRLEWDPGSLDYIEVDRSPDDGEDYIEWAGEPPRASEHMPEFEPGTATHFMMYEDTSEGTPISPAFATAEELAHWLADNKASAFGRETASYEHWLGMIRHGQSPGLAIVGEEMISGVEFVATGEDKP